jgi:hypothetical protein
MDKLIAVIKLVAKTGLFFANVDGEYDTKEREFIENFIANIEEVGSIEDELKDDVKDTLNHTYTLDDIVSDTKALIDGFNDEESDAILKTLNAFVTNVIKADGKVVDEEATTYNEWRAQLGII